MSDERPEKLAGLEMHEGEEGMVVFNEATDRVHSLNNTAAIVLELCDGRKDESEIAALVAATFRLDRVPLEETRTCLTELRAQGLVI